MKRNFKKIIPLIGISTIGISAIISGAVLSINSVSKNNSPNIKVSDKLFSYSMSNLSDINILSNPTELSSYLYNYGALGMNSVNPIKSIDVISKKANANNCYNVDLRVNDIDGQNYVVKNVETSVPVATEISNLNFDRLNDYFLHFNQIMSVYNFLYANNNNNALINVLTSYTNLNSDQISRATINFSNNFNLGSTNTLSFELKIFLNSNYVYNGSNVITYTLPTSIIIDWNSASVNASKFFVFDDKSIIGLTDLGAQSEVLIVPESYTTDNGDTVDVDYITSLSPTGTGVNLSNIKAIILPNRIKIIDTNAIGNSTAANACSNLKWINVPKSLSSLGDYAFANCTNLQNLSLYNQEFLISIGQNAFDQCRSLTDIYLNDKVQSIGNYAFQGCQSLANVRLPNTLTSIPNFLFASCTSLKYLVLPYSVSSIGEQAFDTCSSLSSINMPLNLRSFGKKVFNNGANALNNLVFLNNGTANQIQFDETAFLNLRNTNFTNIYIFGDYNQSSNFNNSFNSANYINVSVESENVYNKIHEVNANFSLGRVFIMDPENLPYVTVSHIPEFIKYWQDRTKTAADCDFYNKKKVSFTNAAAAVGGVIFNNDWIKAVEILSITNNNNEFYRIEFQLWLNNGQYFEINVPLLNPIPASS